MTLLQCVCERESERLSMRICACMQAWMDSVKRENEALHEIETKHRLYSKLKHSASTHTPHTHTHTHTIYIYIYIYILYIHPVHYIPPQLPLYLTSCGHYKPIGTADDLWRETHSKLPSLHTWLVSVRVLLCGWHELLYSCSHVSIHVVSISVCWGDDIFLCVCGCVCGCVS